MADRTCDSCGKSKNVSGGRTCERGHFICRDCVWAGTGGGFFGDGKKQCPLDNRPLR